MLYNTIHICHIYYIFELYMHILVFPPGRVKTAKVRRRLQKPVGEPDPAAREANKAMLQRLGILLHPELADQLLDVSYPVWRLTFFSFCVQFGS